MQMTSQGFTVKIALKGCGTTGVRGDSFPPHPPSYALVGGRSLGISDDRVSSTGVCVWGGEPLKETRRGQG